MSLFFFHKLHQTCFPKYLSVKLPNLFFHSIDFLYLGQKLKLIVVSCHTLFQVAQLKYWSILKTIKCIYFILIKITTRNSRNIFITVEFFYINEQNKKLLFVCNHLLK